MNKINLRADTCQELQMAETTFYEKSKIFLQKFKIFKALLIELKELATEVNGAYEHICQKRAGIQTEDKLGSNKWVDLCDTCDLKGICEPIAYIIDEITLTEIEELTFGDV